MAFVIVKHHGFLDWYEMTLLYSFYLYEEARDVTRLLNEYAQWQKDNDYDRTGNRVTKETEVPSRFRYLKDMEDVSDYYFDTRYDVIEVPESVPDDFLPAQESWLPRISVTNKKDSDE